MDTFSEITVALVVTFFVFCFLMICRDVILWLAEERRRRDDDDDFDY